LLIDTLSMTKSKKFGGFTIIIVALFFLCQRIYAQDIAEDEHGLYVQHHIFYAGVVAGVNLSQVDGDNFAGYYKYGANLGLIGYAKLWKKVALSYELLYSQRGSRATAIDLPKISGIDSILITKYGINVNYAEIPVMINVFDKTKSHIGAGISYSRLLSSSETLQTYPATNAGLSKYPFIKNNMEFVVSSELHIWKGLFFNIRFQYSIIPMRLAVPPNFSRSVQYINMWSLRMMYLIF